MQFDVLDDYKGSINVGDVGARWGSMADIRRSIVTWPFVLKPPNMPSDSVVFGSVVVGVIVGLVIMLYGISLTAGQTWNREMLIGGGITLGSVVVLVWRVNRLTPPEA